MSSGGGGQSGTTQYNWNPFMENMWAGGIGGNTGLLNRATNVLNQPYQRYGESTPFTWGDKGPTSASRPGQRVADLNPDQQSGMAVIRNTVLGNGAPDTAAGRNTAMTFAQGGNANEYMGDNPYFRRAMQSGMEDIINSYKQGTSPDTTRMFNLSGAFGGSAHQNAVANNEAGLARNLSRYANEMGNQQYDRSANLRESGLNRQLQSVPLAFQGQGLSFDAARQLMGAGDVTRNYQQQLLDQQYGDWTQGQNWERGNIDWLSNLLGRAQGSTGASTTTGGYGANPISQIAGLGLLGRSMGLY